MSVDPIPKQLRDILDAHGVLTPPQIDRGLRMRNGRSLELIDSGELHALDLRTPGARRPTYKITEQQILDFLQDEQ